MVEVLSTRREVRAGRRLSLVIEVDGLLCGQYIMDGINHGTRSAEVGVWLDVDHVGRRVAQAAAMLLGDHTFGPMGLYRVTAPIAVDNVPATILARQLGFHREGIMASYLDVGGRRKDHVLWALTADQWRSVKERRERRQ